MGGIDALDVEGGVGFGIAQALGLGEDIGEGQALVPHLGGMKLVVPLMMPAAHSMRLAVSPSRRALMMGMPRRRRLRRRP